MHINYKNSGYLHSICSKCISHFIQLVYEDTLISFILHVIWGSMWVVSREPNIPCYSSSSWACMQCITCIPCYFSSSWTIYDMFSLLFLFQYVTNILFYFSSSWPCVQCTTYSVLFQLLMGNIWHVFSVISAPPGPVCNVKPPMTWTRLRTHFLMLFTGSPWPSYFKTLNVLNAME